MHAALVAAVDAVVAQDLDGVWPDELQAHIAAVAPQLQRLAGFVSAATGRLHSSTGGQLPTADGRRRSLVGWLAEATRSGPAAAGAQLRTAVALEALPLVARAVLEGTLTLAQAQLLARLVGRIAPDVLAAAQPALIDAARLLDPGALARYVAHLLATHCEPALEADADAARARRYWQTRLDPDGTLRGRFVLPAEDAEALLTVLEPLARRQSTSDERSAGQRRADALVEVFTQAARHAELPDAGGVRPQLSYVSAGRLGRPAGRPGRLPDLLGLPRPPARHLPRHRPRRPAPHLPHPQRRQPRCGRQRRNEQQTEQRPSRRGE
jgi:hypothetical protein